MDFHSKNSYIIPLSRFQAQCINKMKKKQQRKISPRVPKIKFRPLDRRYDAQTPDTIDSTVLDSFPYEYPEKDIVIDIETDEFTAVCPWSGLPDFGTVRVNYIPDKCLIELRSFKYYLMTYRNVGIYQEHAANRVLADLVKCCKPKWMQVTIDYRVRGGVHTVASVEFGKKEGK